jgi:hypothetical protein
MPYDAFISYSHAADGKLAPALQAALQRFAKPWYRRRALRIFRDQTSLAATPELWPTIQRALDDSSHFLLLASQEAAQSKWVRREVAHWRQTKPLDQLLIVLTGGELAWDEGAQDFDWSTTTALPPELRGAFPSEPLWVDLRWARNEAQLSLAHPRFLEAVGDLAAPLHGRAKEDLLGEDVRQHRRTMRLAGGAIVGLLLLLVASLLGAGVALQQRAHAETASQLALARQLAAQAENARTGALDTRLLLSLEANYLDSGGVNAQGSLLDLLAEGADLESRRLRSWVAATYRCDQLSRRRRGLRHVRSGRRRHLGSADPGTYRGAAGGQPRRPRARRLQPRRVGACRLVAGWRRLSVRRHDLRAVGGAALRASSALRHLGVQPGR